MPRIEKQSRQPPSILHQTQVVALRVKGKAASFTIVIATGMLEIREKLEMVETTEEQEIEISKVSTPLRSAPTVGKGAGVVAEALLKTRDQSHRSNLGRKHNPHLLRKMSK